MTTTLPIPTMPLRIWPVDVRGERRADFAVANALILARRAAFPVQEPEHFPDDVRALLQIGESMSLVFSSGNPDDRVVAGKVIKRMDGSLAA